MSSDLSRRGMLAGAAAVVAPATVASSAEAELQRLIREAKALEAESEEAQNIYHEAWRRFTRRFSFLEVSVPTIFGHQYSANDCSREVAQQHIAQLYAGARRSLSDIADIPQFGRMLECLNEAERTNLAVLDDVFGAVERHQNESNLPELKARAKEASDKFYATVTALCALPCATIDDYRVKAQALADIFGDAEDAPDDALRALATSLIPQARSSPTPR